MSSEVPLAGQLEFDPSSALFPLMTNDYLVDVCCSILDANQFETSDPNYEYAFWSGIDTKSQQPQFVIAKSVGEKLASQGISKPLLLDVALSQLNAICTDTTIDPETKTIILTITSRAFAKAANGHKVHIHASNSLPESIFRTVELAEIMKFSFPTKIILYKGEDRLPELECIEGWQKKLCDTLTKQWLEAGIKDLIENTTNINLQSNIIRLAKECIECELLPSYEESRGFETLKQKLARLFTEKATLCFRNNLTKSITNSPTEDLLREINDICNTVFQLLYTGPELVLSGLELASFEALKPIIDRSKIPKIFEEIMEYFKTNMEELVKILPGEEIDPEFLTKLEIYKIIRDALIPPFNPEHLKYEIDRLQDSQSSKDDSVELFGIIENLYNQFKKTSLATSRAIKDLIKEYLAKIKSTKQTA